MCSPCGMAERPHPHKATAQRSLGVPFPPSLCMAEGALNQEPGPCTLVSVRAPDRMRSWVGHLGPPFDSLCLRLGEALSLKHPAGQDAGDAAPGPPQQPCRSRLQGLQAARSLSSCLQVSKTSASPQGQCGHGCDSHGRQVPS